MSDDVYKKAGINSLFLFAIQGLNYVFPFLVLPYLLTILSGESFGIYTFSLTTIQFVTTIVDFGFTISISKKIASYGDDFERISKKYWLIITTQLLIYIFLVGTVFFLTMILPYLEVYKTGILIGLISILGYIFFPQWLFLGMNLSSLIL